MKFPIALLSVLVCSVILFSLSSVFIGSTYEKVQGTNENMGWARFNYATNTTTSVSVEISDGVLSLGGNVPQSGVVEDMIIWADENMSVYIKNGVPYYIGNDSGTFKMGSLSDSFTITKGANGISITDGEDTYSFPASAWAYIPNAKGDYGSYLDGQSSRLNSQNINRAYVGGLLDFYTYNNVNSGTYNLNLLVHKNGDTINGSEWNGGE